MASLIPGFEYDIFISYRQKDNKHDGWVTEFVNNLKGELESTFKEEVSVYFDINPHDGLLETHDVDASLKEKLKCLVFIPIISRTYCDPKSFAWVHEFKTFIDQARKDQLGLKVKVPGGNVASRVLPIQIHDLNPDDKKLVESELGGFLRGIEFVYREPGVNRPLNPNDDEKKNLNGTKHKNQINKAANAISDIIDGIKSSSQSGKGVPEIITERKPSEKKNQKTKILAGSLIGLMLIIAGVLFIPKLFSPSAQLEKSIAVLPFIDDSPDKNNSHIINGVMEEILINLQKIKDLRVVSRNSVEQYRGESKPSTPEIAQQLGVNYIVEGSGQKYGNTIRLRVQLIVIKGWKESHLWGESYEQEINEARDYFIIQSKIAESIATELKAIITPEERTLIEKAPTDDLEAYILYQKGKEQFLQYQESLNQRYFINAEHFFRQAIKADPTFALAYVELARVFWRRDLYYEDFSGSHLDSIEILLNKALSLDSQLAEAYSMRGRYISETGLIPRAIEDYNKALKINPNYWEAYTGLASLYTEDDMLKTIQNRHKAVELNHGPEFPVLLRNLADAYLRAGFIEIAQKYNIDAFKIHSDSSRYISFLRLISYMLGNYDEAAEYGIRAYSIDSTYKQALYTVANNYSLSGRFKEGLEYFEKYIDESDSSAVVFNEMHRIGYLFWKNGFIEEGNVYFNKQLESCDLLNRTGALWAQKAFTYYDIAGVYAFRGDKKKAYENLRIFNKRETMPFWMANLIGKDPLFESIRNEPEFQQIVRDVEAKYQAEHERVKRWLEQQGML